MPDGPLCYRVDPSVREELARFAASFERKEVLRCEDAAEAAEARAQFTEASRASRMHLHVGGQGRYVALWFDEEDE